MSNLSFVEEKKKEGIVERNGLTHVNTCSGSLLLLFWARSCCVVLRGEGGFACAHILFIRSGTLRRQSPYQIGWQNHLSTSAPSSCSRRLRRRRTPTSSLARTWSLQSPRHQAAVSCPWRTRDRLCVQTAHTQTSQVEARLTPCTRDPPLCKATYPGSASAMPAVMELSPMSSNLPSKLWARNPVSPAFLKKLCLSKADVPGLQQQQHAHGGYKLSNNILFVCVGMVTTNQRTNAAWLCTSSLDLFASKASRHP